MRRGCISLGEIQCNHCHRLIAFAERYLAIDEENGSEGGLGETVLYCVECALDKGFAYHKEEKGERILTFFP